jgi:hypothetical protein
MRRWCPPTPTPTPTPNPTPDPNQVVASKFEYVLTCQIYGKLSKAKPGSADRWKGDGIDELRKQFSRNLRVGYVDTQAANPGPEPEPGA